MERRHFNVRVAHAEISGFVLVSSLGHSTGSKTSSKIPPKRLLLLHGAGVAGELTWNYVTHYLKDWDEILVPDLPGMGSSNVCKSAGEQYLEVSWYCDALHELLAHFEWSEYSIGGYSFGGLIALHLMKPFALISHDQSKVQPQTSSKSESKIKSIALIEPAALLSLDVSILRERGSLYKTLGKQLLITPNDPECYLQFLNVVSPNRKSDKKIDAIAVQRLIARPSALAKGVLTVGSALLEYAHEYVAWHSSVSGCSFVGGLSSSAMHERLEALAIDSIDWSYHEVADTDHGLIYTRPRHIARLMDASLHLGWN